MDTDVTSESLDLISARFPAHELSPTHPPFSAAVCPDALLRPCVHGNGADADARAGGGDLHQARAGVPELAFAPPK